jgi:thioredoxin-like negative regulator of GroEL
MKPVVDGLARRYGDRLRIVRVNVSEPVGRALMRQYMVRTVPTFVLIVNGHEIARSQGLPPAAQLFEQAFSVAPKQPRTPARRG